MVSRGKITARSCPESKKTPALWHRITSCIEGRLQSSHNTCRLQSQQPHVQLSGETIPHFLLGTNFLWKAPRQPPECQAGQHLATPYLNSAQALLSAGHVGIDALSLVRDRITLAVLCSPSQNIVYSGIIFTFPTI